MRKTFSLNKFCMSLFALTALLCLSSMETQAQNTVITNFPHTHFVYAKRGSSDSIQPLPGGNRYRLTPPQSMHTVAMWYKGAGTSSGLDMSKDFVISFKLVFDSTGNAGNDHISDGFVFCLTTTPI